MYKDLRDIEIRLKLFKLLNITMLLILKINEKLSGNVYLNQFLNDFRVHK